MTTDRLVADSLTTDGKPEELSREAILALLKGEDDSLLFRRADQVRARFLGDEVHLRGIIEFSNHCVQNCLYCGLRRDNDSLDRYRMTPAEIVTVAREASRLGLKTLVLQSGEDPSYTGEMLAKLIAEIKAQADVALTMSVGNRTKKDYRLMKKEGADRYLLKHETADPDLFSRLRPGTTLQDRLKRLFWLRELGYQIGAGNIVGLPRQTVKALADDILLLKELEVEMAGIGPFIPNYSTPLKGSAPGDADMTLRVLAIARIVLPRTHLPATAALATVHPEGRQMALGCGANVLMPNMTPLRYRKLYEIYPNRTGVHIVSTELVPQLIALIYRLGRKVSVGYGHSPKPEFANGLNSQRKEVAHET